MRLSIFGLGHVGQVLCACFAERGHSVIGIDVDPAKADDLSRGITCIHEPRLAELLARHARSGLISATTDPATAFRSGDIGFVCVGTPSDADGRVNTSHLEGLFQSLRPAFEPRSPGHILVIRSTCPWPTLQRLLADTLPDAGDTGHSIGLAVQPEFLREGSAIHDFFHPTRTLIGADDSAVADKVASLYRDLPAEVCITSPACALMVKYADNAFHAMKVAFANEIGRLCAAGGVDADQVMRLFRADARLNCSAAYLRPGAPFGGSCLPKDLRTLTRAARDAGVAAPLLSAVLPSNRDHLAHILRLIQRSTPRSIGLFGIAFKSGTADLRESPSITLLCALLDAGFPVRVFDPHFGPGGESDPRRQAEQAVPQLAGRWCDTHSQLLAESELVVIATAGFDWPAATEQLSATQRILDLDGAGRHRMANDERYLGVGMSGK